MVAANPYTGLPYEALKARYRDVLNVRTGYLREADRLMTEARRISVAMKGAHRENIAVSDHAIIRWLERARGFDVQAIRAEIIAHINEFDALGDGEVISGNGLTVCMAENRVKTVVPDDGPLGPHTPPKRPNSLNKTLNSPNQGRGPWLGQLSPQSI